jgi:hemerythrin-like domain-containing protein
MSQTLPQVAHDHHEKLLVHVDRIPAVADSLLGDDKAAIDAGVKDMRAFLDGTLVPHVDAAERALYPELERMFQNRHSMAPMRREHDSIRSLAKEFGRLVDQAGDHLTLGKTLAIRRVLFQLYALLKVHLAEEEAYLRLVDHGVTDDMADAVAAALAHPVAG